MSTGCPCTSLSCPHSHFNNYHVNLTYLFICVHTSILYRCYRLLIPWTFMFENSAVLTCQDRHVSWRNCKMSDNLRSEVYLLFKFLKANSRSLNVPLKRSILLLFISPEVYMSMIMGVLTKYFFEDLVYAKSLSIVKCFGDSPIAFFVISDRRSALCWNFVSTAS